MALSPVTYVNISSVHLDVPLLLNADCRLLCQEGLSTILILSKTNQFHTPPYSLNHFMNITLLLRPRPSKWPLFLSFPTKTCMSISHLFHPHLILLISSSELYLISNTIHWKWDVKAWTGSRWLRIGTGGGHLCMR